MQQNKSTPFQNMQAKIYHFLEEALCYHYIMCVCRARSDWKEKLAQGEDPNDFLIYIWGKKKKVQNLAKAIKDKFGDVIEYEGLDAYDESSDDSPPAKVFKIIKGLEDED